MTSTPSSALLPRDCRIEPTKTLIGRWDLSVLAAAFGTPLYVYDAVTLRENAQDVKAAFESLGARMSFAAKACSTIGVLRTLQQSGLDIDAVSEGEMVAAIQAGFHPEQIHLHGNCKSDRELQYAIRVGIRAIVVDGADELARLVSLARSPQHPVNVMVRMSLPLEAETHPWLQTSGTGSKFGVMVESDDETQVLGLLAENSGLRFIGLHTHLGSQITGADIYRRAACDMAQVAVRFAQHGLRSEEVSLGGGWAIAYSDGDATLSPREVANAVAEGSAGFNRVRLAVEPGRALVANAAVALYRVGAVKVRESGRIVAVDGGMGDNLRPALYGARYTAFLPNRGMEVPVGKADIVGRYCEAGDVLARDVPLPEVSVGDLICVPVSGAYQLSMANSYNLVPPPASVLVDGRDARLMTRRATISDILAREVSYSDQKLN